jgi:cation/acetate symporter
LLYISAPALAALVKFEVMQGLVGTSFENLPRWIGQWSRVDPGLISVVDINGDRVVQFGEIRLSADMIMLATPELGGLPFVVSGLVAAGGLAAALSTADGLLLTISNAIIRDMAASNGVEPIQKENRVIISKFALLAVAMVAALVAASKPAEILALVTAAFSLAASALFPAMVLGIYWRRASGSAAVAGMALGLAVTMYYMVSNFGLLGNVLGVEISSGLWFGIHPVSAGVFGVPAGMAVILAISLVEGRFVRRA